MEFYDVVDSRRTIRDFQNVSIDDEVIQRIIAAGMKAPTNDHMRDWHFVVIKEKDVVRKLLQIIPLGNEGEWSRKVLNYPKEYLMPCFLAVGKPKENASVNRQKEYSLDERIHNNIW